MFLVSFSSILFNIFYKHEASSDKVIHIEHTCSFKIHEQVPQVFLAILKGSYQSNKFCQSVHYFHICAFLMPPGTKSLAFSFTIAKQ